MDASAGVTHGANVTAITDQSPSPYPLEIFGTVPYSATGINGQPAFNFAAANNAGIQVVNVVSVTDGVTMGTGNIGYAFAVASMRTLSGNFARLLSYFGDIAHGGNQDFNNDFSATLLARDGTNVGVTTYRNAVTVAAPISLNTVYLHLAVYDGTDMILYVDNVEISRTACNKAWGDHGQLTLGNAANIASVGSNDGAYGGTQGPWDGLVGIAGFGNGTLSGTDRGNLRTFSVSKYGTA